MLKARANLLSASLALLGMLAASTSSAQVPAAPPDGHAIASRTNPHTPNELSQALDSYMNARVALNDFSGSVLVARRGRILLVRGYGTANREWGIPNATNTKFRIGSLTKQFTAMLIMQLSENHQLQVTDQICKYLSPCPDSWTAITIRELLSHTSGIPDFTGDPDFKLTDVLPRTVEEVIAIFRNKPLEFKPGASWKYSNSGYVLLGAIIERVTGRPYEDVLSEQILRPLKMSDTGYDRHRPILMHRAAGYVVSDGTISNAPYVETSWAHAAGAMYSTVLDLYRWDRALYSDALLPLSSLKEMWTPVSDGYGYGWGIVQSGVGARKRLELTHDGGIDGFRSHISRFPEDRSVVIVLGNIEKPEAGSIGNALAAIIFGEPYAMPTKAPSIVDLSAFDQYLGDYEVDKNGIVRVTRDEADLKVQLLDAPGQPIFVATRLTSNQVWVDNLGITIQFKAGADLRESSLVVQAPGKDQREGHRVSARQDTE